MPQARIFQPAVRAVLAAAMILTFAVADPTPAQAAKTCKSWGFVGQAIGPNAGQAQASARNNWKAKVAAYWGPQWSHWSMATSRWQSCEAFRGQQRCIANGVPCMPSLGLSG